MLDGRIYRTGLVIVALAVLVLGFSFADQPSPLPSTLAPDAFNGQNVFNAMSRLSAQYPTRPPGSAADYDLASSLGSAFKHDGYTVTTDTFSGQTAAGPRALQNVVAVRPGIQSGSIVIVAARDARGSPATAALSGTATELELARDLAGETLHRTVVLASVSGSEGTAGALRLASRLSGPVDAVITLGDLASAHPRQPIVIPWSNAQTVAPPLLRSTLGAQLSQQAAMTTSGTSLFGQFAHLAFPLSTSAQAPFGGQGVPAVTLSLSGERGPAPDAPLGGPDQLNSVGRSVLATVSALDGAPNIPAPSPYLIFSGKQVPGWALSLLVLALIVPVVMTTIDGLARARRHGHSVWRWLVVVLAAAAPFFLAALFLLAARLVGAISVAPPGPLPAVAIAPHTGTVLILILAALVAFASFAVLRPTALRFAAGRGPRRRILTEHHEAIVAAVLLIMCAVSVAIWLANPFAALLAVPALHLWLAAISPDLRLHLPIRLGLLVLGLVPVAAVAVYYGVVLSYGPLELAWAAVLMLAGHAVGLVAVLEWSLFLGCGVVVTSVLVLAARQPRPETVPVTVRGPVSYAGPGSLGGTESALRR
jgi:hypothetical protein